MLMSVLSLMILGGVMIAQPGRDQQQRHEKQRAEMQEYMKSTVLPVLKEQRLKLNTSLSNKEQAELAEIREQMKSLRDTKQDMRADHKGQDRPTSPPTQEQRRERYDLQKQHRELMNRAWAITDKHEEEILALFEEINPEMEQWHQEMAEMRPERPERTERPNQAPHRGGKHRMKQGHGKGMGMGLMQPVHFLLWDGENVPERR